MGFIRGKGSDGDGEDKPAAMVYLTSKLRIRLTNPDKVPIANGKCRVADDPGTVYPCDEYGVVEIPVADKSQTSIDLEWEGPENGSGESFPWSNSFDLQIHSAEDPDCEKRLIHLGFYGDDLPAQVLGYQEHFGLAANGKMDDIRAGLVDWHEGGNAPGLAGVSDDGAAAVPMDQAAAKKATRKVLINQHDSHPFDRIYAAAKKYPEFTVENNTGASRSTIEDAMKAAKHGDIFVFEGHSYSKLGGPVLGIKGDNWFFEDKIPLSEITSCLSGSPPSVAVFCACNSDEVLKSALAGGVKLVFGINNVVRDTISDVINWQIADQITSYLMAGETIGDATDKVNAWLSGAPLNNGNQLVNESDSSIDITLNLEDNGL